VPSLRLKSFNFICLIQWLLDQMTLGSALSGRLLISRNAITLFWDWNSAKTVGADTSFLLCKVTTETGFLNFEVLWFFLESEVLFHREIKCQWSECSWEERDLYSGIAGRIIQAFRTWMFTPLWRLQRSWSPGYLKGVDIFLKGQWLWVSFYDSIRAD
jgi:hypothetical protein